MTIFFYFFFIFFYFFFYNFLELVLFIINDAFSLHERKVPPDGVLTGRSCCVL
jgi:hypothetical protein